jgi:hypothetical protein
VILSDRVPRAALVGVSPPWTPFLAFVSRAGSQVPRSALPVMDTTASGDHAGSGVLVRSWCPHGP